MDYRYTSNNRIKIWLAKYQLSIIILWENRMVNLIIKRYKVRTLINFSLINGILL